MPRSIKSMEPVLPKGKSISKLRYPALCKSYSEYCLKEWSPPRWAALVSNGFSSCVDCDLMTSGEVHTAVLTVQQDLLWKGNRLPHVCHRRHHQSISVFQVLLFIHWLLIISRVDTKTTVFHSWTQTSQTGCLTDSRLEMLYKQLN